MDKPAKAGLNELLPKTVRREAMNVIMPPRASNRTLSQLQVIGIANDERKCHFQLERPFRVKQSNIEEAKYW